MLLTHLDELKISYADRYYIIELIPFAFTYNLCFLINIILTTLYISNTLSAYSILLIII